MAAKKESAPKVAKAAGAGKMGTDELLAKAKGGDKVAALVLISRDVKKLAMSEGGYGKGETATEHPFQTKFARVANYHKGAIAQGVGDDKFMAQARAAKKALESGADAKSKWSQTKGFFEALLELQKERGGFTRKPLAQDDLKSFSL